MCVPLLAACGGGLVALVVMVFLTLFPRMCSRCPSLHGCLVQTPDYYFGNPFLGAIRGGTGSSFASAFVGVPAALDGKGLVILTEPYFRGSPPLLSSGRDSLSQEFIVGRSWWRLVRRVLPAVWLAFQQGPSVSCRRVLLLLPGVRAASMVAVFARAAVGFVLGLRVHVGVSRRLRELVCGVAFIGAGLLPVDPVEGSCLVGCPLVIGVCPCWMSPCYWGCVLGWLCVWPCVPVRRCALCSAQSTSLLELSRCFVCWVAPLVERCDTWLLRCIAWLLVFWWCFPKLFCCCPSEGSSPSRTASVLVKVFCCVTSLNEALVVLVEVLPEPVCVASAVCCVLSVGRLVGLHSGDVFPERLLALWVEVLPKLPCVCFSCRCSLSEEMSCRCFRLDYPCDSLLGLCRSRCGAFDHVSGCGAGQASFRCVFLLCLSYALEALVAIGRVALPTCGGLLWRVLLVSHVVSEGAWVHCVVPWEAPGACVGTVCWAVCPGRKLCASLREFAQCLRR
ncbi:hypothetical protein Taro_052965 [Colocasia esculenta]|uniref:Uncharacterized protein n=1 Tax=Colocasia esculenta TaxID=4460 RepID=A0A843XL66_COLES|nr:hypothetical protein [Colocasia esculenta]